MHFIHRIRTIWSWLPAFRAVGETEHLPTAAHELGIVPSSVSRAVKQLEDELGIALFDRSAKALALNDAGRMLLAAVRDAMRIVDDALGAAIGDDLQGNVGAVAESDLVHAILIPAAAALVDSTPSLALSTLVASATDVPQMLLCGDADAAVVVLPPPAHTNLRVNELARLTRGVFGRAGRAPTSEYRWIVGGGSASHEDDGWPLGVGRRIAVWAPDERAALELCARSDLVTIAFDAVVQACGLSDRVVRLPEVEIPPRTIHLVHRREVGRHRRTEALVNAIRAAAAAASM